HAHRRARQLCRRRPAGALADSAAKSVDAAPAGVRYEQRISGTREPRADRALLCAELGAGRHADAGAGLSAEIHAPGGGPVLRAVRDAGAAFSLRTLARRYHPRPAFLDRRPPPLARAARSSRRVRHATDIGGLGVGLALA